MGMLITTIQVILYGIVVKHINSHTRHKLNILTNLFYVLLVPMILNPSIVF